MRVPPEVVIDDVVSDGPRTLRRDVGEKWFVYGGRHSSAGKLTPLPSFTAGKTGLANVHVTVPMGGDETEVTAAAAQPGSHVRARAFHVTFDFAGTDRTALRFEYDEVPGSATLRDQEGRTLAEVSRSTKDISTNITVARNGALRQADTQDRFGSQQGKSLKWQVDDLETVADRIAREFHAQCLY